MYIGFHVKCSFLSDFSETFEFSWQIFEKFSNIKYHENPSSGIRVFPCGQAEEDAGGRAGRECGRSTDRHDEANIRLSQFANEPKKLKFTLEKAMRAQRESRRRETEAGCQRHPSVALLHPGRRPGTHCTWSWVGRRAGLDGFGKSGLHRALIPGPPARSELLYRLSYPETLHAFVFLLRCQWPVLLILIDLHKPSNF
jgi:hypothetical protein